MASEKNRINNEREIIFMAWSHVLWDFNGTILDDVEAGIQSANILLSRRNMKTISSVEDYRRLFCFPIIKYYKNLGFDFGREPFENLAEEWMEQYLYFSGSSRLFDGVSEALSHFKALKIPQVMLSATEKSMLIGQMTELGITGYFDEILGLDNIHAYSKVDIAKEWKSRVMPRKAVLFGDTVHDFEVASEIGADCVLIAGGHQNKETLLSCGVPVFDSIKELLKKKVI